MARRPFYGQGGAIPIAKMNMQAATAPGRAYAQMGKDFGDKIGSAIEQYGLNKAKRAKLTGEIEAYYEQNPNAISEIGMSGDEAQDKKDFAEREKFMKGDMSMAQLEGYAGKLARGDVLKTKAAEAESRRIANDYQIALTKSKTNENNLFDTTKLLTTENKELTNKSKRLENLLKGVEAYLKIESLPEELQSTLRKHKEDIAEADAKEASRKAYSPTQRALDEMAQASATINKTNQDIEGNKSKNKITPLRDAEGNVQPGSFMINGTPFTKDATGTLARVGTPSENVGEIRTNKAEELINQGRQIAKDYDVTSEPLDANVIGGADLGGMYEDTLLYVGGKLGLSGKQIDSALGKGMFGDTEAREVQTARIKFLNNKIKPALVRAVTARGNVYTQKQIDQDILAQPNEDNSKVSKKLREYPRLLEDALIKAESVIRDPEIKPGTRIYEDARQVALQVPKILKQLNASIGETDQYDMDPSLESLIMNSPGKTVPVVDSNISEVSDIDLLKLLK